MKISDFRAGLADLQAALRKWGATKQAAELDSVAAALAEFDDLTLAELARRIKATGAKPRPIKAAKPINVAVIERHLAALKAASHSSEAFDHAVNDVMADKTQLASAELKELARQFGGSVPAKTSRPAIAAFLKARRLEMRRQDGIGATIDRMFGRL
jgi:hypothetical protein